MSESLKAAVAGAVFRLLVPLVRLLLEVGIGSGEFHQLTKRAYVRAIQDQHAKQRLKLSQITVPSGLTRAEVASILKEGDAPPPAVDIGASRAERVLRGWWNDPDYQSDDGQPLALPIRGSRRSFHTLVLQYAGGTRPLPILRELERAKAVQRLPGKKLQVLSTTVAHANWENAGVEQMGEQVRYLIETLSYNLKHPSSPRYARFVIKGNVDPRYVPVLIRDLTQHAELMADNFQESITVPDRNIRPGKSAQAAHQLGVGIFVLSEETVVPPIATPRKPRRRAG